MAKVKEYKNWNKIIFGDRAILKSDLKYLGWSQIRDIENLDVLLDEDKGRTLVVENK